MFYVPGYTQLGREDVPHHPLLVYDIRHPTGEKSEGVGHPVAFPHLAPLVAEQDEGQAVFLGEPLVRLHGIRTYPYHLGSELLKLLVAVPEGTGFLGAA
jgi:hypothetical protein